MDLVPRNDGYDFSHDTHYTIWLLQIYLDISIGSG